MRTLSVRTMEQKRLDDAMKTIMDTHKKKKRDEFVGGIALLLSSITIGALMVWAFV